MRSFLGGRHLEGPQRMALGRPPSPSHNAGGNQQGGTGRVVRGCRNLLRHDLSPFEPGGLALLGPTVLLAQAGFEPPPRTGQWKREWGGGDNFLSSELKDYGFQYKKVYGSAYLGNVPVIESQLQQHFQPLPLGTYGATMWNSQLIVPSMRLGTTWYI